MGEGGTAPLILIWAWVTLSVGSPPCEGGDLSEKSLELAEGEGILYSQRGSMVDFQLVHRGKQLLPPPKRGAYSLPYVEGDTIILEE